VRKYLSQYVPKLTWRALGWFRHIVLFTRSRYFLPGNIDMNAGHIVSAGDAHVILHLVSEAARALSNLFKWEGVLACDAASYLWLAAFLRSEVAVGDRDGLVMVGPAALSSRRAPSELQQLWWLPGPSLPWLKPQLTSPVSSFPLLDTRSGRNPRTKSL
jgi:hypothetical protein